jgi:hypothetical protein
LEKAKSGKSKKSASRGKQTLFRVTYRTQVNLIRIADNKANMIMGINAVIITVIMGIISSNILFTQERIEGNRLLIVPVFLVVLTALLTTIYAVRAAKPRLLNLKKKNVKNANTRKSLLFFENVWSMPDNEYMEKMEKLIEAPQEIYQHMIIDIHNQSKVLHKKYDLIRKAYLVFMIGFSASILAFLILWALH